ncbi:transglycosylase SLT domain-containing protein [Streptomyces sp. S.PNR 29]|uniref:golvesin C-terminal-like domain-containing protein n=1 Tax=Streptomyces sp. S.PNR 29 TaxID=2973805 RepID=UPI0025AFFB09|nr:transglycosylase SLT domain-containing protein [Streptomyces sp. S.PNR 29]MDN0200532.1 transglycosylase SLT domain-containing protein [Streptomyces sp. S.PNR 29]
MALLAPLASAALSGSSDPTPQPLPDRVTDTSRLPSGWQKSGDRMVTYDGDATGLHILVADAAHAYRWRTAATLSEPGIDTDQWIGQTCVTGSGDRAVVVYAPRQATNDQQGFQQGAFAAVVDLADGTVTKLPQLVSLAYFNPGCGSGERAVLSRPEGEGTQLLTVDARQGKLTGRQTVPGQLTSAVPFEGGIAAATRDSVVSVNGRGHVRTLARTVGTPFRLVPDAHHGLAYQVPASGKKVQVRRVTQGGSDHLLGSGPLGALAVRGGGGRVFVTGKDAREDIPGSALPKGWKALDVPALSEVSTTGHLALTRVGNGTEAAGRKDVGTAPAPATAQPVGIKALVPGTGATFDFRVQPRAPRPGQGAEQSPALSARTATPDEGGMHTNSIRTESVDDDGPAHTTTDPDRACAVTRNDPELQALQPSPAQVEWATDLAVQGKLDERRRKGWNGTDLPSYTPQELFPPVALKGGGRVPAQIMLGVLAQESNLVQATSRASAGESGNFIQGGYYGNAGSVHTVNWAAADCGYGIAQVTSGMAKSDATYTAEQQKAITVDYAANIAAGLQILQDKWNQLHDHGMLVNGGDPEYLENWWFALWAYNSGFNLPDASDAAAPWGLGWFNNPANGLYPPDRKMFLSSGADDARNPNLWTYPERVLGWAAYSQQKTDPATGTSGPAFTVGSWPTGNAPDAQPPHDAFCKPDVNDCDTSKPRKVEGSSQPTGPCQRDDFKCWWHQPATWTDCATTCGTEVLKYQATDPEPEPASPHPASCASTLPRNALIVDDVPNTVKFRVGSTNPCAGLRNWTSRGTLSFTFGSAEQNGATVYPSKIDFHQLGSGFGGHFWFTHTRDPKYTDSVVTGTWTPDRTIKGWARVMVHLPDHEATTGQATYHIDLGDGTVVDKTISQDTGGRNAWVSLGSYEFHGTPSVSLSSDTADGTGDDSIAWDALAFEPLPGEPADAVTPAS